MEEFKDLASAFSFDAEKEQKSPEEERAITRRMMLHTVAITNNQWGNLDKQDGYNCPICRNKGEIYKVYTTDGDTDSWGNPCIFSYDYITTVPCSCMQKRQGYQRSRMSGLPEGYTFETFKPETEWQQNMKRLCERYLNEKAWKDGAWLYIGGAVGAGKTHIVTALARELVFERDVFYMNWVRVGGRMKAMVNDNLEYTAMLRRCTDIDVLFIDDFLHSKYSSEAENRLAYDILNERYINHKPTLFTSELYPQEIQDESIKSRIFERAKDYMLGISRDKEKDVRMK